MEDKLKDLKESKKKVTYLQQSVELVVVCLCNALPQELKLTTQFGVGCMGVYTV